MILSIEYIEWFLQRGWSLTTLLFLYSIVLVWHRISCDSRTTFRTIMYTWYMIKCHQSEMNTTCWIGKTLMNRRGELYKLQSSLTSIILTFGSLTSIRTPFNIIHIPTLSVEIPTIKYLALWARDLLSQIVIASRFIRRVASEANGVSVVNKHPVDV